MSGWYLLFAGDKPVVEEAPPTEAVSAPARDVYVPAPEPEPEEGAAPMEELSPKKRAQALLDRLIPDDLTEALLMDAGVTPAQLIGAMRGELGIPEDYTMTQARMVLGVQYELSVRKLDNYAAYVLAQDIDTPFISLLSDGNYAGAKVTLSGSTRPPAPPTSWAT